MQKSDAPVERLPRWAAVSLAIAFVAGLLVSSIEIWAGRYEEFMKKAEGGEKLKIISATYFGGTGNEEFVSAGALQNGTIVAFGNSWEPELSVKPNLVLGKGQFKKLKAEGMDDKKRPFLRADNPDISGLLVLYESGLKKVKKVIRFDPGVATISSGLVCPEGNSVWIAGRSTSNFKAMAASVREFHTEPNPGFKNSGEYTYEGVKCPGDVYIAKFNTEDGRFDWIWVFEGFREVPDRIFADVDNMVYFSSQGFNRISADGSQYRRVNDLRPTRTAKYLAVDPNDGSHYYGGDRNTNTGHEPWRQPFFYKFDSMGQKLWKLWEWDPKKCGSGPGQNHLESDSSPRAAEFDTDGNLVITGWSDGGNSVFTKMANNVNEPAPSKGFGIQPWGMKNANSLGHIMVVSPTSQETLNHQWYACFIPDTFSEKKVRGAPNHASLEELRLLADGSYAFTGKAATGLISTPNAFYKYPNDGNKYGGEFVTVLSQDSSNLLFSSYLPGLENVFLGTTANGLLIVGRSRGNDGGTPPVNSPITKNALQNKFGGGIDAYILLLELPKPPPPPVAPKPKPPDDTPEETLQSPRVIARNENKGPPEPPAQNAPPPTKNPDYIPLPPAITINDPPPEQGMNWPYLIAGVGLLIAAAILGIKMFGDKAQEKTSFRRSSARLKSIPRE